MPSPQSKKILREKWRSEYPQDEAQRSHSSKEICKRILQSQEFLLAENIGLYRARPWEIDVSALWKQSPQKFSFPKVNVKTLTMKFYRVVNLSDMKPGAFGISEPTPEEKFHVHFSPLDWVLVPGMAFDRLGNRIGSGAGYYDRFLSQTPVKAVGVCYFRQVLSEHLEPSPTDVRMHVIFTEHETIWMDR